MDDPIFIAYRNLFILVLLPLGAILGLFWFMVRKKK